MERIATPIVEKEHMVLTTCLPYDKTRCYAPGVLKFGDEYLMYYTGSNDNPSARSGYRLMLATSKDGASFEKTNVPVLDLYGTAKSYSAEPHLQEDGKIRLYFSVNTGNGYRIY